MRFLIKSVEKIYLSMHAYNVKANVMIILYYTVVVFIFTKSSFARILYDWYSILLFMQV
jgi:hypothetical protein